VALRTGSAAGHTLRVTGMTCAACERRVGKALGRLPGVETVSVSSARGRAVLTGSVPPRADVEAALHAAGYTLGAPPWLSRDRGAWLTALAGGVAVTGVLVLAVRSGLTGWTPAESLSGPVLALLVGLAAGVSTCMAMVGGLVLAVSATASRAAPGRAGSTRRRAVRAQAAFTAGRWAGFAAGGALLGAVGSAARLPDPVVAAGMLLAAAVMAVLGLRLTGLSPRAGGLGPVLPRRWADRFGTAGDRGAAVAGAATFLLPCGFTQAMQLYAVSLRSPGASALVMVSFAVGTTPGLAGLGLLGGLARGRPTADASEARAAGPATGPATRWPALVGVVVIAFAVVTGVGGLRVLGLDLPWPGGGAIGVPTATSSNVRLDGAVQVVSLTQSSDGYHPADTVVWAGVPIRWEITSTSQFACSSALRVPALGVRANLNPVGLHVVDLPALDPGTTGFRCAMGMYSGTLRAIARPPAASVTATPTPAATG